MLQPKLVAECIEAMRASVKIPVTVKTRIGVDEQDSYEALQNFICFVMDVGCDDFIIHARKAWLSGLSPKENREVPPLRYDIVYQLKQDFPSLAIMLNGGVKSLKEAQEHLKFVDGVMLGRAAYEHPYVLSGADQEFYGSSSISRTQAEVIEDYLPYMEAELRKGVRLRTLTRHLLGFFQGLPRARLWRRYLSEHSGDEVAGVEVVREALKRLEVYE